MIKIFGMVFCMSKVSVNEVLALAKYFLVQCSSPSLKVFRMPFFDGMQGNADLSLQPGYTAQSRQTVPAENQRASGSMQLSLPNVRYSCCSKPPNCEFEREMHLTIASADYRRNVTVTCTANRFFHNPPLHLCCC